MGKYKDLRQNGLYSTKDILVEIKKNYNITDKKMSDSSIIRKIQRYLKEKPAEINDLTKGNTKYYTRLIVDSLLESDDIISYFSNKSGKKITYQSDEVLRLAQINELKEIRESIMQEREDLELSQSDADLLLVDRFNEKKYLQIDELHLLGKKGIFPYDNLTVEENELLAMYNQHLQQTDSQSKEIEQIFYQKKMELMVTALFNEHFYLDEKLLHKDIENFVRGGEYSSVFFDESIMTEAPSQDVRRSYLRFKEQSYVHKKYNKRQK